MLLDRKSSKVHMMDNAQSFDILGKKLRFCAVSLQEDFEEHHTLTRPFFEDQGWSGSIRP